MSSELTLAIINIIKLVVIFKVGSLIFRVFKNRSTLDKKHSIIYKYYLYIKTPLLYKLDDMLYVQRQKRLEILKARKASSVPAESEKVVNLKNAKKKKSNQAT